MNPLTYHCICWSRISSFHPHEYQSNLQHIVKILFPMIKTWVQTFFVVLSLTKSYTKTVMYGNQKKLNQISNHSRKNYLNVIKCTERPQKRHFSLVFKWYLKQYETSAITMKWEIRKQPPTCFMVIFRISWPSSRIFTYRMWILKAFDNKGKMYSLQLHELASIIL